MLSVVTQIKGAENDLRNGNAVGWLGPLMAGITTFVYFTWLCIAWGHARSHDVDELKHVRRRFTCFFFRWYWLLRGPCVFYDWLEPPKGPTSPGGEQGDIPTGEGYAMDEVSATGLQRPQAGSREEV